MKSFKKGVSLLLCMVLLLSVLPTFGVNAATVSYAVQGGNIYFDTATGTVTDCDNGVTAAHIPSTINGIAVKAIGLSAFSFCTNLTDVSIPGSVVTVGRNAFGICSALKNVTIGQGVVTIDTGAFANCSALERITIPNSVTTIGEYAFERCTAMTSAVIGNGVTSIGPGAFNLCSQLVELSIGSAVTSIGYGAFNFCTGLVSVTLPPRMTTIEDGIFSNCTALEEVILPEGITSIGNNVFFECQSLGNITIPEKVTSLGQFVFYNCKSLESVKIPQGVNIIRTSAFSDCSALTTIAIPDSVQTIESTAFYKCTALKEIHMGKGLSRIEARAFFGCTGLEDVYYAGSEPRWNDIYKGSDNTPLYTATVHFAEDPVEDPTEPPVEDPTVPPAMTNPFKDVKETDYFYAPVLWAVENGITNGTSSTTFSPEKTCTRGQVVTFLWRAAGSPEPTATSNPFSDIREKDYFYKAVLWAVEKGITTGTGKGKFSPEKDCTRAQVATFLWRSRGEPMPISGVNTFTDVAQGAYYYNAVLWAVENGVTNGTGKGKFSPDNSCTRGQIVTFLYRALA